MKGMKAMKIELRVSPAEPHTLNRGGVRVHLSPRREEDAKNAKET